MKTQIQKPARGKASYSDEYKQQALELWRNSGRSAAKTPFSSPLSSEAARSAARKNGPLPSAIRASALLHFRPEAILFLNFYFQDSSGVAAQACIDARSQGAAMRNRGGVAGTNPKKIDLKFFASDRDYIALGGPDAGCSCLISTIPCTISYFLLR